MTSPPPILEPDEATMFGYLGEHCQGAQAARTQQRIADDLGWPRRAVHDVCARLRLHAVPVGSSCGGADPNDAGQPPEQQRRAPVGMYICVTYAERNCVMRQLQGRMREAYQTYRTLGGATISELDSQLRLWTIAHSPAPVPPPNAGRAGSEPEPDASGEDSDRVRDSARPAATRPGELFPRHPLP